MGSPSSLLHSPSSLLHRDPNSQLRSPCLSSPESRLLWKDSPATKTRTVRLILSPPTFSLNNNLNSSHHNNLSNLNSLNSLPHNNNSSSHNSSPVSSPRNNPTQPSSHNSNSSKLSERLNPLVR